MWYFFESDFLFQCGLANLVFTQLPMRGIYSGEVSSLKPLKQIKDFGIGHIANFSKRLVYQYFLLDFNIGSLEIIGFII